jgi:hypothetical protein
VERLKDSSDKRTRVVLGTVALCAVGCLKAAIFSAKTPAWINAASAAFGLPFPPVIAQTGPRSHHDEVAGSSTRVCELSTLS